MSNDERPQPRGQVYWEHFTWARQMMPPDARPLLIVFLDRDGVAHVSGVRWFLKQLTTDVATVISDSVREYLTGMVRPRG